MNNQEPQIIIGERHGWHEPQPFGIAAVDERQHVYIIGKTGSGKTTLLRNLILQHIYLGHGVGVIDPHGDLAEELLNHIPPKRADHLVYFNPGDIEFPIGMNVIGSVAPDDRHLVASGIVGAFKGIWRDSWGPRLEYILYNAVSALLECRNQTLLGVNRLLTDDTYRAKVIRQIKDPFIRAFWAEEYENYDERFKREAIAPIQNKIGQFLLNPVVRNILGQVRKKVDNHKHPPHRFVGLRMCLSTRNLNRPAQLGMAPDQRKDMLTRRTVRHISTLPSLLKLFPENADEIKRLLLLTLFDSNSISVSQRLSDYPAGAILNALWKENFLAANSIFLGFLMLKPAYDKLSESTRLENRKRGVYDFANHEFLKVFSKKYETEIGKIVSDKVAYSDVPNIDQIALDTLVTAFKLLPVDSGACPDFESPQDREGKAPASGSHYQSRF